MNSAPARRKSHWPGPWPAPRAVHPILGVRRLGQLHDNLGALDITLPTESMDRLEAATGFDIGFPHDFIRDMQSFVFGDAGALVDES